MDKLILKVCWKDRYQWIEFVTISMDMRSYLQKIGHLFDVPGLGRGIDGDTVIRITPTDWMMNGHILTPNVRLAKHRLTSESVDISSLLNGGQRGLED